MSVPEPAPAVRADIDPFEAYTEAALEFQAACPDIEEVLPPFTGDLLAAAGRGLGHLFRAYARNLTVGGDPPHPTAGVIALLPPERAGWEPSRLQTAAAWLEHLSGDIEAGRAPLPRCGGEVWALETMIERAAHLLAASDTELERLGVRVPQDIYRPPLWEEVYSLITPDAALSIPEARSHFASLEPQDAIAEPGNNDGDRRSRWEEPAYWSSPFSFTRPRTGPPSSAAYPLSALTDVRWSELLGLSEPFDAWEGFNDHSPLREHYSPLAEVITPQAAVVLHYAAGTLLGSAIEELGELGSAPLDRDDPMGSFFELLPRACDRQDAAWRLEMVRALDDLATDLRTGRAPIPRTTGEEVALRLILDYVPEVLDELQYLESVPLKIDEDLPPMPRVSELSVRHLRTDYIIGALTVDEDVLFYYDPAFDGFEDPDNELNQHFSMGDLRPSNWHNPEFFRFVTPRDPHRGYDASIAAILRDANPELRELLPEPEN